MKRTTSFVVRSLVTILIGSGTLVMNLHAQSDPITVSIPFPFTVGTQSIPPGTYRFSLVSSPFVLSVLNVKTDREDLFPVRPESERVFEPHGHLIFGKSEDSHALNEVHFPGSDTFSEVVPPHRSESAEAKESSTSNGMSVGRR